MQSHHSHSIQKRDAEHIHDAKCFTVTCMDFRLIDDEVKFMNSIGYNKNYDEFVLAGASLGFTQDKYPSWGEALIDHMKIGEGLHHFKQFIFIDHRDCGAYKKFYPDITAENEQEIHAKHMQMAHDKLAQIFPNFRFRGYLMDLKGHIIHLPIQNTPKISQEDAKVLVDEFLHSIQM